MNCDDQTSNNCVCEIVKEIAQKQDKISKLENKDGCGRYIQEILANNQNNLNTIPLLFVCKNGCGYFIGSGIFRDNMNFICIETPVFRVTKVHEHSCCAELELLQPQTATGTVPPFTNQDGVCRFFPANQIQRFIRTGLCLTIDLNCFCGVECLPAVNAERGTPQLPPDVCTNPIITVDAPEQLTCTGIITGSVTCNGEPVENAVVFLNSNPDIINFDQNPVLTGSNGNYSVIATVDPGTEETIVVVTAETTVNGITVMDTDTLTVSCPANGDACNGCGIHVGTEVSSTNVTVVTPEEGTEIFTGTLNLNLLSCGESCNPANNNFTIQFRGTGDDTGTTINFIEGSRIMVSCVPGEEVTYIGTARVTGNNPYPNNQVFTVTIELTGADTQPGQWTITATDGFGNTFTTTFSGTVNPNVIQSCP